MSQNQVILSGIRATGRLHFGNYLGAMVNMVELQNSPNTDCFFFVADYHTLTSKPDPAALRANLPEIVAGYLAAGLDPTRVTLYAQSSVPEIAEITLLLSMMAPVGELVRMPQYEKMVGEGAEANAGLLTYPILMAADILGPRATIVPVGSDQLKHIEFARELARRFNNRYCEVFPIPEASVRADMVIPSLDGSGKMGKSESGPTLDLLEKPTERWEKIRVAKTDPARQRLSDPGNPHECNFYQFHVLMTQGDQLRAVNDGCRQATMGCVDCKKIVSLQIDTMLEPYRDRYTDILKRPTYITEVLHEGGKHARSVFRETLDRMRDAMGLSNF